MADVGARGGRKRVLMLAGWSGERGVVASVFLVFNLHGAGLGCMFVSFEYQVRGRPSP